MLKSWPIALAMAVAVVTAGGCGETLVSAPQPTMTRLFHGTLVPGSYVSSTAYQHYLMSRLHAQAGRVIEAVEELRQAIAADPTAAYLRAALAEELLGLGHLDEARDEVEVALRLDPDFPEGHLLLGRVRLRVGDAAGFQAELERAVAVDRSCTEAYVELATYLEHSGADARALEVWRELVRQVPASAAGHLALGRAALGRLDTKVAEQHLRRAFELEPGREAARFELAMLLRGEGRTKEALTLLDRLGNTPSEARAEELAVRWLLGDGQLAEARARVDRLDEVGMGADLSRRLLIGHLRVLVGQPEEARRLAESAGVPGRRLLGDALAALGRDLEAVTELGRIAPSAPEFFDAQRLAAHLLAAAGRGKEGVELLARAAAATVKLKAEPIELEEASALLLEESGEVDAAVTRLRTATTRWPDSERLSSALVGVWARQGHWERAVEEAQRLLAKRPNAASVLNQVGALLAEHNLRLADARRFLERALRLRPSDGNIADSLGWLALRQNRLDDAAVLLERADRLVPGSASILGHLGALYMQRADRPRAVDAYRRALSAHPTVSLRHTVEEQLLLLERGRLGAR